MNKKVILTSLFFGLLLTGLGQQSSTWNKWNWLIGDWVGAGSGQPGQGGGTFSFKNDLDQKILIIDEIFTDDRVVNKATPFISVTALTESTVNITVRAEVKQNDYWDVLYQYLEKVKVRFDREGIHFPFPQRDIHVVGGNSEITI